MITVSGLTKKYGDRTVVDDVSFELEPGTVTGFLGPNGAGKTTTMRMMTSLVAPTAGSAVIDGKLYAELPNPGAVVGTLLDASAVHPGRTGRTHLRLLASAVGVPASRADEVLEMVGLSDAANRRIGGYSLGMRQRLGIAGALLADPPVLMFDEPANGLDPEGIRWMRDLLRALAAEGRTVLVSSHLLSEMQLMAEDVVILAAGRLIRQGPVDEVLGSMGAAVQVRVRTPDPGRLTAALAAFNPVITPMPDGGLLVTGMATAAVGHAAFSAGVELHELAGERADLEQVFLQLTAGKAAIR
jgi:ABC-2 type transport system ATP-binding protein